MTLYLSASSIKDFLHCSQMFYYRQECPEESVSSPDMIIGNIVHWTLEKYWDDPIKASDYVTDRVTEFKIDKYGDIKIRDCLANFYNSFPELTLRMSEEDHIEFKFKEKIADDIVLTGKMDRIITDSGIVVDWKTGSTKKNISNDVQFIIYYQMYKRVFGHAPNRVVQVNLNKRELVDFYPEKEYIDTLFNKVIPYIANRIKAKEYLREGYFTSSCYRCSFDTICYKDR